MRALAALGDVSQSCAGALNLNLKLNLNHCVLLPPALGAISTVCLRFDAGM